MLVISVKLEMAEKRYLQKLGIQLRAMREKKGFTQESLALTAGIDRSYYGGIERGERNISFLTLIKIAKCLSCDLSELTKELP